jgi:PAS domain S-box-containing protein
MMKSKDRSLDKTEKIRQLLVQTEKYKNLATQILEQLNQIDYRADLIKNFLLLIKVVSDIEGVGIRLQDGENFPYYETLGFPEELVLTSPSLYALDRKKECVCDADGGLSREGMCGTILCGRIDPARPFFTDKGSFWTNSTTGLRDSATEIYWRFRTCGHCLRAGYESMALIPLSHEGRIVGLLQLSDCRKNRFTATLISYFERLGAGFGVALRLQQQEKSISQCRQDVTIIEESFRHHNLFQFAPISIWEFDFSKIKRYIDRLRKRGVTDFRDYFDAHPEDIIGLTGKMKIRRVNQATLTLFQAEDEAELSRRMNTLFTKELYDVFKEQLIVLAEGNSEYDRETIVPTLRREERHILLKLVVPSGYVTTLSKVFAFLIDISLQKRREEELLVSAEKYRRIVETSQDAVVLADLHTGVVLEANTKAEELFGFSAPEIVGLHFTQLHPAEEAATHKQLYEKLIHQNGGGVENLVVCHRDGPRTKVSLRSSIVVVHGRNYLVNIYRTIKKNVAAITSNLTKRECEILQMIASGLSAKQIAKQLNISDRTVRSHREHIMQKLNIHKTVDLVRYAMTCGLIDTNS